LPTQSTAVQALIRKLSNYGELSTEETRALADAVSAQEQIEAGKDMVLEGSSPTHSVLLIEGLAGRYNMTEQGQTQITSLFVAGDFVDLQSFLMKPMDHSIRAISLCRVANIPHTALNRISEQFPRLGRILWLHTLVDGGMARRWCFAVGSMLGPQHLAHLVCEMYLRLKQVGLVDGLSFHLPLTQARLGECLALSVVHTNRVMQSLRSQSLIRWDRDRVTILDWERLVELAEFDGTYLRMPDNAGPHVAFRGETLSYGSTMA